MFRYPENISYTTMTAKSKIDSAWYGMKFAAAPRNPDPSKPWLEGAILVMQYVESYVYRTYGLYRGGDSRIQQLYDAARGIDGTENEDYPTLEATMKACQGIDVINGSTGDDGVDLEVGYVKNTQNDLKYFLRQYGQLILETRITSTTHNQNGYEITSQGTDLGFEDYSKGFIMYGYDADNIYVQNTRGIFAGSLGFHKIPWSVATQIIRRGACWWLKNPS